MEKETSNPTTEEKESLEIIFPEESAIIIQELLKKYDFDKEHEESVKKLIVSRNPKEKKEIFENLPGYKISRLVKEYAERKIPITNLLSLLKKELNCPNKKAEELTRDIEKEFSIFLQPKIEISRAKESLSRKLISTELKPPDQKAKKTTAQKPDTYRELIE